MKVKWLKLDQLYRGKAPSGPGSGNWFGALLEVKRIEDITRIFAPLFQPEEDRLLSNDPDAFEFWNDEREDLYQDFLDQPG